MTDLKAAPVPPPEAQLDQVTGLMVVHAVRDIIKSELKNIGVEL